jgi:hypothetical protein
MDAKITASDASRPSPPIDVVGCVKQAVSEASTNAQTVALNIYANTFAEKSPQPTVGEKLDTKIAAIQETAHEARVNVEQALTNARDSAEKTISSTRDSAEQAISSTK